MGSVLQIKDLLLIFVILLATSLIVNGNTASRSSWSYSTVRRSSNQSGGTSGQVSAGASRQLSGATSSQVSAGASRQVSGDISRQVSGDTTRQVSGVSGGNVYNSQLGYGYGYQGYRPGYSYGYPGYGYGTGYGYGNCCPPIPPTVKRYFYAQDVTCYPQVRCIIAGYRRQVGPLIPYGSTSIQGQGVYSATVPGQQGATYPVVSGQSQGQGAIYPGQYVGQSQGAIYPGQYVGQSQGAIYTGQYVGQSQGAIYPAAPGQNLGQGQGAVYPVPGQYLGQGQGVIYPVPGQSQGTNYPGYPGYFPVQGDSNPNPGYVQPTQSTGTGAQIEIQTDDGLPQVPGSHE